MKTCEVCRLESLRKRRLSQGLEEPPGEPVWGQDASALAPGARCPDKDCRSASCPAAYHLCGGQGHVGDRWVPTGSFECFRSGKRKKTCADCAERSRKSNGLCASAHCTVLGNARYDGYCRHCFVHTFPGDDRVRRAKRSREARMVGHVLQRHPKLAWVHDKPLYTDFSGGCCDSKRRCDLRVLVEGTWIVIECDEDRHKYYASEDARYNDLVMDCTCRWIFIRFNPDKYRMGGVTRDTPWDERLERLSREVAQQVRRVYLEHNCELVELVHLYYDDDPGLVAEISP